jgi:NADH:ubiquinone oxidoreductase subunit K
MITTGLLMVGAALAAAGIYAILAKRNVLMILIGIELILNAAMLNFVVFSRFDPWQYGGQIFALFIMVLAAASIALGLAIVLMIFRQRKSLDPQDFDQLKEE